MARKSIIYNSQYFFIDEFIPEYNNRAFRYGDSIFETIFVSRGKIPFFELHINRIVKAMRVLKMEIPGKFTDSDSLKREIQTLLVKNRFYKGAVIRLRVFRETGGLYTPESNKTNYFVETESTENELFVNEQRLLKIGIYTDQKKEICSYSFAKTGSAIFSVLAGIFKKENNLDDVIILNQKNYIVETLASNIFFTKGNTIYTPDCNSGCVAGTMRHVVIEICKQTEFNIIERENIETKELLEADEVFTTNAISGITKISAFENKRYFGKISKKLIELLNAKISG